MAIRIAIADDHADLRHAVKDLVAEQADMEVVGMAEDGRQAVKLAQRMYPDVIVMDLTMPIMNGAEATRQILAEMPRVKVLALSIHADKHMVSQMMRAGASGYLLKDCVFEHIVEAIRTVAAGETYLYPRLGDTEQADNSD